MTGAKLNKIYTKFVFFKASPDGSIVWVVLSLPAGTASPWAGYGQGWATVQNRTKPGQNRTLLKMFSPVRRLKRAFSAYYVEFRCSRAGEPGNLGVRSA